MKKLINLTALLFLIIPGIAFSAVNKESFAPAIKKVAPAVVSIYASNSDVSNRNNLLANQVYDHLLGNDDDNSYSIGSGVIVSKNGLIITNDHVIKNYNNIIVVLNDGRDYKAKLVADNKNIDLALLKITDNNNFSYLNLYDNNDSEVGDVVLALGNPFGIGQTVTSGIISGFRYFENIQDIGFGKLIQIDAVINPGNSGGALINNKGELIGINSSIYSYRRLSFSGIGFAIPASVVKLFVSRSLAGSSLKKYWIGLTGLTVDNNIAKTMQMPYPKGIFVTQIYKGGPADAAGIKPNDVISRVNDEEVETISDLSFLVAKLDNSDTLKVVVLRNKKYITLKLTPDIPKETPPKKPYAIAKGVLSGTVVVNNSPAVSYEINTDSMVDGVVIYDLDTASLLAKLGVRVGDFLVKIGDTDINNTEDVKNYIENHYTNSYKLLLKRRNEEITLNINHNGI